jgi:CheY-like chemotaxis protein/anti-sigma regulatory factor (Ser/Thr protein kinase)
MPRILIAEDSPTQALQVQAFLEDAQFEVEVQPNGAKALAAVPTARPQIVLTDLDMPEMNGLELVSAIRKQYPSIPVVVMTAHGTEDTAVQALQAGAASYVPKRILERDIINILRQLLSVQSEQHSQQQLFDCLSQSESRFSLPNDPKLIGAVRGFIHDNLCRLKLSDHTGLIRLGVALDEALTNAMWHGNLECSSKLREGDGREFDELLTKRRQEPPYCHRKLDVQATFSHAQATIVVRDEGPGFDVSQIPDPTDPENLVKASGRGLLLIRAFMDEVFHNATGNQITMIKHRESS